MRPTAIIPALCCAVALVLSFLCLFAGHKKDFMEDYHLLTVSHIFLYLFDVAIFVLQRNTLPEMVFFFEMEGSINIWPVQVLQERKLTTP